MSGRRGRLRAVVNNGGGRRPDRVGLRHRPPPWPLVLPVLPPRVLRLPQLCGAPLAAALTTASGSWAVVAMGQSGVPLNTFWQMFFRASGAASWTLVTPTGVADNGGLTLTAAADGSVTVGFEPSQLLHYLAVGPERRRGLELDPRPGTRLPGGRSRCDGRGRPVRTRPGPDTSRRRTDHGQQRIVTALGAVVGQREPDRCGRSAVRRRGSRCRCLRHVGHSHVGYRLWPPGTGRGVRP